MAPSKRRALSKDFASISRARASFRRSDMPIIGYMNSTVQRELVEKLVDFLVDDLVDIRSIPSTVHSQPICHPNRCSIRYPGKGRKAIPSLGGGNMPEHVTEHPLSGSARPRLLDVARDAVRRR